MNFAADLAVGETIASITSVTGSPSGLTISEQTIDVGGKKIQCRFAGTPGSYKVTGKVATSDDNVIEGDGILLVKDT